MIYESALKSNLSSVRRDLDCYVNQVTGIACAPSRKGDGISKDPDGTINVIYAIVSGVPMTVIERVDKSDYTIDEMTNFVKEFNSSDCGYTMAFAENGEYYDVSVVATKIIIAANSI